MIGTLFSGGEGVSIGARMAGVDHAWGIEYDADIAGVAQANGFDVAVADVTQCDPRDFEPVDILHASPPCPNFSVAKTGGGETAQDIALAEAVARFITALKPRCFTAENVYTYRKSESWQTIAQALHDAGYAFRYWHLNAADYAVPQSRKRMIVVARRDGVRPRRPKATHGDPVTLAPMFDERQPWISWYEAIRDLIPTLPDSEFADWQLARLPNELKTLMMDGTEMRDNGIIRERQEPSITIKAEHYKGLPRAFILGDQERQLADAERPAFAVTTRANGGTEPRAFIVSSQSIAGKEPAQRFDDEPSLTVGTNAARDRAYVGRVVQMTPRALARFQGVPDSYVLPDSKTLACRVLGNMVPPPLYAAVVRSIL